MHVGKKRVGIGGGGGGGGGVNGEVGTWKTRTGLDWS